MRRWRSRAFVRPLLVTVVGVVLSVMLYLAVTWFANGPSDRPCTYSPDACGYAFMGQVGQAFGLLPVLLIGLQITGLVVGLSSRDSRLAFRAVLVGPCSHHWLAALRSSCRVRSPMAMTCRSGSFPTLPGRHLLASSS
jgi:hypothetical protein